VEPLNGRLAVAGRNRRVDYRTRIDAPSAHGAPLVSVGDSAVVSGVRCGHTRMVALKISARRG
jgi:hypothetical protein